MADKTQKLDLTKLSKDSEQAQKIVQSLVGNINVHLNTLNQSLLTIPSTLSTLTTTAEKNFFTPMSRMMAELQDQSGELFSQISKQVSPKKIKTEPKPDIDNVRNGKPRPTLEPKSSGTGTFTRGKPGEYVRSDLHEYTETRREPYPDINAPRKKLSDIIPREWYLDNITTISAPGTRKTVPDDLSSEGQLKLLQKYFGSQIDKVVEETQNLTDAIGTAVDLAEWAPGESAVANVVGLAGKDIIRNDADKDLKELNNQIANAAKDLNLNLASLKEKVKSEQRKISEQRDEDLEEAIIDGTAGGIGKAVKIKKLKDAIQEELLKGAPKGDVSKWFAEKITDQTIDGLLKEGVEFGKYALESSFGAKSTSKSPKPSVRATTEVEPKNPYPKLTDEKIDFFDPSYKKTLIPKGPSASARSTTHVEHNISLPKTEEKEAIKAKVITAQEILSVTPPSITGGNNRTLKTKDGSNSEAQANSEVRTDIEPEVKPIRTVEPRYEQPSLNQGGVSSHKTPTFEPLPTQIPEQSHEAIDNLRDSTSELRQIEEQYHTDSLQGQQAADEKMLEQQQETLAQRVALFSDAYNKISQYISIGSNASKARSEERSRYVEQLTNFNGSLQEREQLIEEHKQRMKEIDEQEKQEKIDMLKNFFLQELTEIGIQELAKLTLKTTSETSQTAVQEAGAITRSGISLGEAATNLWSAASSVASAIANAVRWVFTIFPFPISLAMAGVAVAGVYGLWEGARAMLGFAEGGHVQGPGSETSDSIPARLSNNEFVIKASSAKALGMGTLEYLNTHGTLPLSSTAAPVHSTFGLQRPLLGSSSIDSNGQIVAQLKSLERTIAERNLVTAIDPNAFNLSSNRARSRRKAMVLR